MRPIIFVVILSTLGLALVGAVKFSGGKGGGPDAFADVCTTNSDKITGVENCSGGNDGKFVEMPKSGEEIYLQLDMGQDQEGTGNLTLYYKINNDADIRVEFLQLENEKIVVTEPQEVHLRKELSETLVTYAHAPTPYRYVRVFTSSERKYQFDGVQAETNRPDSDGDGMDDVYELQYGLNPLVATGNDGPRADLDGDGLTNIIEYQKNKLNPRSTDTDVDGLTDDWEVKYNLNGNSDKGNDGYNGDPDKDDLINGLEFLYGSNPQKPKSDKDSLKDGEEVLIYGTNPTEEDTDNDMLGDGWEVKFLPAFNPTIADDPNGDNDGDQLTNFKEFKANTNPLESDTDKDCTSDFDEVNQGKDPNKWEDGDCDNDGLNNGDEKNKYNTKVDNGDSDNDGLPDKWEVEHQFDPNISTGENGPNGDADKDGATNMLEYQKVTNPYRNDTDKDGLPDIWEITHCTDPNVKEGINGPDGDIDGNGYTNFVDMGMGTLPPLVCPPP